MTDKTYIFINSSLSKDHKAQSLINNYTNNCIIKYQYIYKFTYNQELSTSQMQTLQKLLGVKYQLDTNSLSKYSILIANRSGSKSPWSEKSKQIISNCGFNNDLKIEQLKICLLYTSPSPRDS